MNKRRSELNYLVDYLERIGKIDIADTLLKTFTPEKDLDVTYIDTYEYSDWIQEHKIYWSMIRGRNCFTDITYRKIRNELKRCGYVELVAELDRHHYNMIRSYTLLESTSPEEFFAINCVESYQRVQGQKSIESVEEYVSICRDLYLYGMIDMQIKLNKLYPQAKYVRFEYAKVLEIELNHKWRKARRKLFKGRRTLSDELQAAPDDVREFAENFLRWASCQSDAQELIDSFQKRDSAFFFKALMRYPYLPELPSVFRHDSDIFSSDAEWLEHFSLGGYDNL